MTLTGQRNSCDLALPRGPSVDLFAGGGAENPTVRTRSVKQREVPIIAGGSEFPFNVDGDGSHGQANGEKREQAPGIAPIQGFTLPPQ